MLLNCLFEISSLNLYLLEKYIYFLVESAMSGQRTHVTALIDMVLVEDFGMGIFVKMGVPKMP